MRIRPAWIVAALVAGAAAAFVAADTVHLPNGSSLEGKVKLLEDGAVELRFPGGGSVTLAAGQYTTVEFGPTPLEQYGEKRGALAADDAQGHYALGVWCRSRGLKKEAEDTFRAAIAADPDHAEARKALGFVCEEGAWVSEEEYRRRRGEELFDGRWVSAEEKERLVKGREAKELAKYFRRLVDQAAGTGKLAVEAQAALDAEPRDDVVVALVEGLQRSTKTRVYAAWELGRHQLTGGVRTTAVRGLAGLVVGGSTGTLRGAALDSLKAINWSETPVYFFRELYAGESLRRIFALQALMEFPDPRAIQYVLGSFPLVWRDVKREGGMFAGVSASYLRGYELVSGGTAGRGVSIATPVVSGIAAGTVVGGGEEENSEERKRRAEAYLRFRVLELVTGEPFGTNLKAWQQWWRQEGEAKTAVRIAKAKAERAGGKAEKPEPPVPPPEPAPQPPPAPEPAPAPEPQPTPDPAPEPAPPPAPGPQPPEQPPVPPVPSPEQPPVPVPVPEQPPVPVPVPVPGAPPTSP